MTRKLIQKPTSLFSKIKQSDENGNEYWTARDLSKALEYSEYRHFIPVIARAKDACTNSGQKVENHFEQLLEMVPIGSGAQRKTEHKIIEVHILS